MPSPVILFHSPAPVPYAPKLLALCAMQEIKLRVVDRAYLDRTVGALAQGPAAPEASPEGVSAIPEPMLVFCFFTDSQLDRFLAALRRAEVPRTVLKAVLTPSNAGWTLPALYEELCRERQSLGG